MDKKTRQKYKKLLEAKREELLQACEKHRSLGTEVHGAPAADMVDMATNASTKEFLYSLSNSDREILLIVEAALARIESGEYGECIECGEKMKKKRLNVIPWARFCLTCQELFESGRLGP
ncbi:MAG: TraR/DksA family transcriptional regulator [Acidobacteriota bacterium]